MPFVREFAAYGDRRALITVDGELSYRELTGRVHEMGERLGVERRLVLVTGGNAIDPIVTYLAALAGGHPVLLVPENNDLLRASLIANYDPDVIADREGDQWQLVERRHRSSHDLHPDLALLLCTSGSTGSPKLVRLSHENLQANADAIADYLDIASTDRSATTLPMHYCYGLSSHLSRGAGLVLTDLSVVERCFWELFAESRCTSFAGVPYTFDLLDRIGFPDMVLPHLRYVTQAGGRLAPDRVAQYAELADRAGWDFFVMYGQTEATARMAYLPPKLAGLYPDAIGVPIPGGSFELEPVPECSDPETGELVYAGRNVMLGYAESSADLALGRTLDTLRTGDLARRGANGLYSVVGRRRRFIKVLGLRIDLPQAEAVFDSHGMSVVCVGNDDELIVAHDNGHKPEALRGLAVRTFGLPASAVRVCRLPELPRLATGKPDYSAVAELTKREPQSPSDSAPAPANPGAADPNALLALFAELLDRPQATPDDSFVSLGGDSLSYVEMSLRLELILGHLSADWPTTPIRDLTSPGALRGRRGHAVETSVVLRAVGIVLIVCTHVQLFDILGSAHVLIAVAGFNYARFQLTSAPRRQRLRNQLRSIVRIAIPSIAWITIAFMLTEKYRLPNVFLLNAVLGSETWNQRWHFWFVEVLLYLLVGMALLLAIPWVDRVERRGPFGFAIALLALGLLTRSGSDSSS